MRQSSWVKAFNPDGTCDYYPTLAECCQEHGIRYTGTLLKLIETGGLADDGKTFFDYPTEEELKELMSEVVPDVH